MMPSTNMSSIIFQTLSKDQNLVCIDINTFNDFCKKYNINLPSIDCELANYLKDPINKHSISLATSYLKNSSAGGPDGISSLLLKDLNKKLPDIVQNAFLEELNNGNLDINGLKYRDIIYIEKKQTKRTTSAYQPYKHLLQGGYKCSIL